MKKFFLGVFILVDILVIVIAALFLKATLTGSRPEVLNKLPPIPGMSNPAASAPVRSQPTPVVVTSTSTDTVKPGSPLAPNTTNVTGSSTARKILFSYRNSKSKKVMVRADFTGWRAEPMEKDAQGVWKYMAMLEPGEYAYCYSVDDKSIRDPANKHTKTVGKTIVSSIVVQPLTPTPR